MEQVEQTITISRFFFHNTGYQLSVESNSRFPEARLSAAVRKMSPRSYSRERRQSSLRFPALDTGYDQLHVLASCSDGFIALCGSVLFGQTGFTTLS